MKFLDLPGKRDVASYRRGIDVPVDWEKYQLTNFLSSLERAAISTFANCQDKLLPLLETDQYLAEQIPALLHEPSTEEFEVALLILRNFSTQRAGARLSLSGQQYEARAIFRASLECGLYAWVLSIKPDYRPIWANRDKSLADRKAARNAFQWSDLVKTLVAASPDVGKEVSDLYEKLIELGAHPNVGGVHSQLQIIKNEAGAPELLSMMGGSNPKSMEENINEMLLVTQAVVHLLQITIPERLKKHGGGDVLKKYFP